MHFICAKYVKKTFMDNRNKKFIYIISKVPQAQFVYPLKKHIH